MSKDLLRLEGTETLIKGCLNDYLDYFIWRQNDKGGGALWSKEMHQVGRGKQKKAVYFAGIQRKKTYVGFYYFPMYCLAELKTQLSPTLLSHLKGKSCFHIKKGYDSLQKDIHEALSIGLQWYQAQGWARK